MSADDLTDQQLLLLDHNNHFGAFTGYLNKSRHSVDKQGFLRAWVKPDAGDFILECGSSSGKTSIDFASKCSCRCLGVDFDPDAIAISTALREEHFPELKDLCSFELGDLTAIPLDRQINKILMPDFTEHIPDRVFSGILRNIRTQLQTVRLYIYTPLRSHIFEILKHNDLILRNPSGHINVKTRTELITFLTEHGWEIEHVSWRTSSIPVFKYAEMVLGRIPLIGSLFQRRIAVIARPAAEK